MKCPCCKSKFKRKTEPYETESEMECGAVVSDDGLWLSAECHMVGKPVDKWMAENNISNMTINERHPAVDGNPPASWEETIFFIVSVMLVIIYLLLRWMGF